MRKVSKKLNQTERGATWTRNRQPKNTPVLARKKKTRKETEEFVKKEEALSEKNTKGETSKPNYTTRKRWKKRKKKSRGK